LLQHANDIEDDVITKAADAIKEKANAKQTA
jgi:hypothetical protein